MSPGRVTATAADSTISFSAASKASVEACAGFADDDVGLADREAGQIEVILGLDQALQLDREQLLVPAGVQGKLVVGQDVGAFFGRGEVREAQAGHRRHADRSGGKHPAVAGDDAVAVIDQDRVGEPVPLDRFRDLLDLFFRVRPCVARIGLRPSFDHLVRAIKWAGGMTVSPADMMV